MVASPLRLPTGCDMPPLPSHTVLSTVACRTRACWIMNTLHPFVTFLATSSAGQHLNGSRPGTSVRTTGEEKCGEEEDVSCLGQLVEGHLHDIC